MGEANATLRVESERVRGLQTAPFSLRDGLFAATDQGYSNHQSKSPFESHAGVVLLAGDVLASI
jgi:hypothetical protein